MKIELSFSKKDGEGTCTVIREPGDPKFRDGGWGDGESRLLYHVQQALKAQGYDFIKKRMWKDGHLVDQHQQYLRERKLFNGWRKLAISNDRWAIEGADKIFNQEGKVVLSLVNIYELQSIPKTKFKDKQKVFIIYPDRKVPAKVKETWFVGDLFDHYIVEDDHGNRIDVKESQLEKR